MTRISSDYDSGTVAWSAPSNIAIIKYWGKYGNQLPRNASLSLTLTAANTTTKVNYVKSDNPSITFLFEGKVNEAFRQKIINYIEKIGEDMPFLSTMDLHIESENTFPHSSGIASSASAMAALAMCFCQIENKINGETDKNITQRASHIARLGSGSASRSVLSKYAIWGAHPNLEHSSNKYAVAPRNIHDIFDGFHDDILIISGDKKSVSSTAGHALMEGNPYAEARYKQANQRLAQLLIAMEKGDIETFGKIAEDEAMTLHALMMCSDPSYILMKPNTLTAIERIRAFRKRKNVPCYFTLDAGPNIHLLYPDAVKDQVGKFITTELKSLCVDGRIIKDKVGNGPKNLM